MHRSITFTDTLLHYELPLVVTARDGVGGSFVGVSYGEDDSEGLHPFALVQVDRPTMQEVVRGQVDLRTVLAERPAGLVLVAKGHGAPGESVLALVAERVVEEALPLPGMFMPSETVAPLAA